MAKYNCPSMEEVNKIAGTNGFKSISLFAGSGGSSLGYKMAGYDVLLASEFIPNAKEVYELNHPNVPVLSKDIRDTSPEEILEIIGLKKGELDLLDGSPPCSSYSVVGKREELWGKEKLYSDGVKQRTDDLFNEYIRIVEGLMPKVFVAENVKGLTMGKSKKVLEDIIEELDRIGYNVEYKLIDGADFGVPQTRLRCIIIGVRKDLGIMPSHPSNDNPYIVSVKEAFDDLKIDQDERKELLDKMKNYSIYPFWLELEDKPLGSWHHKRFSLCRNFYDKPSRTITQRNSDLSCAGVCHSHEARKYTIGELKRLFTYPDDFKLTGKYNQQAERLGRSVPPLMMKAIGEHVRDNILTPIKEQEENNNFKEEDRMNGAVYKNVVSLYKKYGEKIDSEKKLIITYWKLIDGVKMDKDTIDTKSYLEKATNPADIIDAKMLYDSTLETEGMV